MARAALAWGVRELALAAQISPGTVARFERGEKLRQDTIRAIQRALEDAGCEFIIEDGHLAARRIRLAAWTMFMRAGCTSSHLRVLRPQSGLTHI